MRDAPVALAAKRLLAKKNVQTELDIRAGERSMHMRVEFAWPDHYHAVTGRADWISIGDDRYEKLDDLWVKVPIPTYSAGYLYSSLFTPQRWKDAKDIRTLGAETLDGHRSIVYTYQTSQGKSDCFEKLWIGRETGLPARVETTCSGRISTDTTQVYSYDSTIAVEAPPSAS